MEYNQTTIEKKFINTSYGKVCYRSAGSNKDPLFLIVHGSGVNSSSADYENFLYEYLLMYHQIWKIYLVAIDCPGYGESTGLRSVIRAFPTRFLQEIITILTGKESCFMLMGHSQGGYSIFNALLLNPNLCNFLLQDRPVCGDIKRLKDFKIPTLLVYDEEDDGHPIRQGKLIIKMIKYYKFFSYKASNTPYWISDNLFGEILKFLYHFRDHFKYKNEIPDFESIQNYNGITFSDKKDNNKQKVLEEITNRNYSTEEKKKNTKLDKANSYLSDSETTEKRSKSVAKLNKESKLSKENKTLKSTTPKEVIEEVDEEIFTNKIELKLNNKIVLEDNIPLAVVKEPTKEKDKTTEIVNYKCPLCLELIIYPLKLPCEHVFCYTCIDTSLTYSPYCPLCRRGFDDSTMTKLLNIKNVDKKIEEEIMNKFDTSFIEKRQKHVDEELIKDKSRMIKIEYGNTSTRIDNNKSLKPRYQWKLYVKVVYSCVPNPIKYVEYNINTHLPDCKPIRVNNNPYVLEKSGTFEFAPLIKVFFKDNLKLEPYSVYHGIKLGPEKTCRNFIVYVKNLKI